MFLQPLEGSHLPVTKSPMKLRVGNRVILDFHCCHVADNLLVFDLHQREAVASFVLVVIMLDVGRCILCDIQLDILGRSVLL